MGSATEQVLEVRILGAFRLHDDGSAPPQGNAGIYCVCEIPGKPHTRFQTGVADDVRNPAWEGEDHVHTIEDYVAGEPLTITLLQDDGAGNHEPSTVGVATLQSSSFYPGGFQGEAPLLEGSGSAAVGARLQLCVRAPAAEEQAATSPSGHNVADVTVQVDTFTGLRRREDQPPGRPHTYLLRAVWVGQDGGLRTPERLGAQSKAGGDGEEDCTFKQQIKLRAAPGVDELVVGLFRLIDGTAEDELIGACKLDTRNPDHCKVHTHPVMDRDNTPTGAIAKMKLKVTMRDGGDAKRAVTPMLQMPDDTDQEWPPASSPGSLPSTARGRFTPPGRAPPRSPRSRIDPFDGAPDRVHELYAEHEHRRARREQLVAAKEEEELLALESEREALKRNRQLHRGATDNLSPTKASERLYNDAHRRRVRIEAKVREQDGLLKAKPSPRASVDPHAVSNRLYEEHQRRIQVQEKRRHEKEAREAREIDELQRRAPPAGRAGEARHEQMYAEAEAKRERLDKMRRAAEEREAQMRSPVTNGARRTAANPQRFEQLYEDHENRQMRMMKLQKDFQANQEARLASEAYRAPRSPNWASPSRHAVCVVLAAVRGVDCGRLLDPASPAPLEAVKEAVQEALATEAELPWDGAAIAANMTTEISEGDGGALALRTTIELPAGLAQAAQDALDSSADLCEVLAKAVEDECTEEIFVDELVVSNISVSLVAGTPASARRTASPGSRLLAGTQSSNSRTQSHPSTKPPPPELKTAVDYAVAAVVSAVQLRSGAGGDAQPSSAELRALAASLRPALGAYSNAQSACEKVEGYSALCQRGSHRLFQGGLLPDAQAWQQGRDLDPIRQVRDDLDELLATAGRAQAMLQELVAPEADAGAWAPGRTVPFPSGVPRAAFAYSSGPKSREDAFAKARIRYAPAEGELSFRHVLDFAQVAIVFPTCETLLFGLEDIVRRLDVVGVRNRFSAPAGRLGRRHVDVLVVVSVLEGDGDAAETVPHVCEIRLEDAAFHGARQQASASLDAFVKKLRTVFKRRGVDIENMAYLARWALEAPPEKQALRVFKRRFALHFGSVVCGWRTLFGNCRLVSFEKFKKACCVLQFADRAAEYWSELDIGLGGCISLFEMDPDTTVLLAKLHARIAAVLDGQRPEDVAADVVFQRLTTVANLRAPDRMDIQQFRLMAKSLGLTDAEAGRAFNCLDIKGGRNPPALVTVKDVAWLKGLSALVDIEAVVLPPTCSPLDELEEDWRTPEPQEAEASSPSSPRRPAETHAAPRVAHKVANAAAVGRTSSTAKVAAAAKAAPPPRAARGAPAGPKRAAATPAAAAAAGGALLAAAGGAVASGRGSRGGRPEEARAALGGDAAEAAADAAPAPEPPGGEGEKQEAAVGARAEEAADAEGEEEGIEEDEDGKDAVEEEATDTEEDEEEEEEEEEDEGQKDTDEEEAEGEEWVDGAEEDEAEDEPEDAEAGVGLQDDVEEAF